MKFQAIEPCDSVRDLRRSVITRNPDVELLQADLSFLIRSTSELPTIRSETVPATMAGWA